MNSNPSVSTLTTVPLPVQTGLCASCGYLTTDTCPSCQQPLCAWCLSEDGDNSVCWPCAYFRNPEFYVQGAQVLRVMFGNTSENVPA